MIDQGRNRRGGGRLSFCLQENVVRSYWRKAQSRIELTKVKVANALCINGTTFTMLFKMFFATGKKRLHQNYNISVNYKWALHRKGATRKTV